MTWGRFALGVDVGGTFTDLTLIHLADGRTSFHKTPSTPGDPSVAVARGVEELLAETKVPAASVSYFGHGTTVGTNALIQGRTAKTGLVTTTGFRDVLEIRRQRQPHNYDIRRPKPASPVPRRLRRELAERTYLGGDPPVPPRLEDLPAILEDFRGEGVAAIAVCFLHSYFNPAHEAAVADAIRERLPGVFVCASHEVLAEFREYERLSTTVFNASLGPVMSGYLTRLVNRSGELELGAQPHIILSNGGMVSAREAAARPVRTIASGPAAGVIGAVHVSGMAGERNIITFDVGGTSTDVCLISEAKPLIAHEREFAGFPIRSPMIDVHSVGAGGGSIAWVDPGGTLRVGPQSAGADPGPACYGKGGAAPTVTDANVVLGRLHPEWLLGGRMPIRKDLARQAIEREIAFPLGLRAEEAAQGILTILNENMIQAVRVISVERGFDPRLFTLVAFGGAGPLLASSLARELGIKKILVPEKPGLLCALGLLVADIRCDFSVTRIMGLEDAAAEEIRGPFRGLEEEARDWLRKEGIPSEQRAILRSLDMRYLGQSHEITLEVPEEAIAGNGPEQLAQMFQAEHERLYGYVQEAPIQLVTFRVSACASVSPPPLGADGSASGQGTVRTQGGTRRVYFSEAGGFVDCPIYPGEQLAGGVKLEGPCIIEQMDTTTVVLPGQTAKREDSGPLILTFG